MGLHKAKKGLNLPITGAPDVSSVEPKAVTQVAVLADDFPGMKPRFIAREGEVVKRGQPLFEDRKQPGVLHTAPAAGTISKINRGARRALQSIVIDLSEGEKSGSPELQSFEAYSGKAPAEMSRDEVVALLIESGSWASFRTRPFGHTPAVDSVPAGIFVCATDSSPLAASPEKFLEDKKDELDAGLIALGKLTEGPTFLTVPGGSKVGSGLSAKAQVEEFSGPHPAGTVGFQIHTLFPAHRERVIWTLTAAEAVAIGHLVKTGELFTDRLVTLCGPAAKSPRLLKTRTGARIDELVDGELNTEDEVRKVSGSVLSGRASNEDHFNFLGRRDVQVSLLKEAGKREFLGWLAPGGNKFSVKSLFLSALMPGKKFDFTTDTNGSSRAMVPIGMYEKVMPFDILPTHLLRALLVGDLEMAEKLGALELDEEDLALCTFVCPQKTNFGIILRANLERAFAEG